MSLFKSSSDVSYRDSIDASAEREAAAMEWFRENLGQAIPCGAYLRRILSPRRNDRLFRYTIDLVASHYPGLPTASYRYPLAASLRAHRQIAQGTYKFVLNWNKCPTRAERLRQAQQRAKTRLAMLSSMRKLRRLAADEPLSLPDAMQQTGFSDRAFYRGVKNGELTPMRSTKRTGKGPRVFFRPADVVAFIQRRLDKPLSYPNRAA